MRRGLPPMFSFSRYFHIILTHNATSKFNSLEKRQITKSRNDFYVKFESSLNDLRRLLA